MASQTHDSLEKDVDALFKLPLAEFTDARNALAARLKKDGRAGDATLVKALTKPSISAWAVNQLYWKQRAAFDRLIATGRQFHQAQKSRSAGKIAGMRDSLDARRELLSQLTDLATALLQDAGHNPTLDMARRITTTLEALSVSSDGPSPGRLTQDVDPPGFEALASLMTGAGAMKPNQLLRLVTPSQTSSGTGTKAEAKSSTAGDKQQARKLEENRQLRIVEAKASLQDAKKSLTESRARVQRLETEQKKAQIAAKQAEAAASRAEKQMREAEQRFMKARTASQDAAKRRQGISEEADKAAKATAEAKLAVEEASKELDSLLRDSPARSQYRER